MIDPSHAGVENTGASMGLMSCLTFAHKVGLLVIQTCFCNYLDWFGKPLWKTFTSLCLHFTGRWQTLHSRGPLLFIHCPQPHAFCSTQERRPMHVFLFLSFYSFFWGFRSNLVHFHNLFKLLNKNLEIWTLVALLPSRNVICPKAVLSYTHISLWIQLHFLTSSYIQILSF